MQRLAGGGVFRPFGGAGEHRAAAEPTVGLRRAMRGEVLPQDNCLLCRRSDGGGRRRERRFRCGLLGLVRLLGLEISGGGQGVGGLGLGQ